VNNLFGSQNLNT